MTNPEDQVIGAIDDLIAGMVDDSLAVGPVDDYSRNFYPKCPQCRCDWHGTRCETCGCAASQGEVVVPKTRDHRTPGSDFVTIGDARALAPGEQRGYTLSDVQAMRSSWVRTDYPRRFGLLESPHPIPRVRFWSRTDGWLHVVEGLAQVLRVDWNRRGASVALRMLETQVHRFDPARGYELDLEPAGEIPDGMVTMEGATADGFEMVGWLHPDDLDIQTDIATTVHQWGNDIVRNTMDSYEVTVRINVDVADPLLRRLTDG